MKRNKIIVLMLLITLTLSTISITADEDITLLSEEKLVVEKTVRKIGGEWKESVTIQPGDCVHFRINVTYHNTTGGSHWAYDINITDTLPVVGTSLCLEYQNMIQGDDPTIYGEYNEKLTWVFPSTFELRDDETLTLIFETKANTNCVCCNQELENKVEVTADEQCTGMTLTGQDSAWVYISCDEPGIEVEKKVWNYKSEQWVETGYGVPYEDIRFNITVENTGDCTFNTLWVNDTLDDGLEYNNDATPSEPAIDGQNLSWVFNNVGSGKKIFIEFDATLMDNIPPNEYVNEVEATGYIDECCCPNKVADQDSASVKVRGMKVEKEVSAKKDGQWGPWLEQVEASSGQTVKFRIMIYYYGYYTLYDIHVEDTLPDCLEYDNQATPEEPDIDGNTLTWDLDDTLGNGQHTTVTFQAIVNCSDCISCINYVSVVANECSGDILNWEDTATVDIVCELTANAGGPYTGEAGEPVTLTGEATNGIPPYIFEWDLDNDGVYETSGNPITHTWDEGGVYTVWLKVTDDNGNTDEDYAMVTIENEAPNPPSIDGPIDNLNPGLNYTYEFQTTDSDGDQVYYYIKWGDGEKEEWIGPYDSGEIVEVKHSWAEKNKAYTIQAKAKDEHNAESSWSTLKIETPAYKGTIFLSPIFKFLENYPILYQILLRFFTI